MSAILGYASEFSVPAGGDLQLHFSAPTNGTRARLHFYRWRGSATGAGWSHSASGPVMVLDSVPRGVHDQSWGWPSLSWPVPAGWRSGVYVAVALPEAEDGASFDPESRRLAQVLFVVRNATPGQSADIVYKVPLLTYAAYNSARLEGTHVADSRSSSLYDVDPGVRVTLLRPGLGTDPWDTGYPDYEDSLSPRQTFAHWDAKMVGWLECNGYTVDYCTDLDVHRGTASLSAHRLLLSVGHDEYWTESMRSNVEAFVAQGGNVAFFSGNTAWWRTEVVQPGGGELLAARLDNWADDRRETRLTGVSYRHGAGMWGATEGLTFSPRRDPVGYLVQQPTHWVFAGATLPDGSPIAFHSLFGADERLIGYEADGAMLAPEVAGQPRKTLPEANGGDGTPATFEVLAVGYTPDWNAPSLDHTVTMGTYTNVGQVFTAATTDWARVLAGGHPTVDRITRNVLDRLSLQSHIEVRGPHVHGACNPNLVAVGGTAVFFAANLPSAATCAWQVEGAMIVGPANHPSVAVLMPLTPDEVTVSVVASKGAWSAAASLSCQPVPVDEYVFAEIVCELRHLVTSYSRSQRAVWGAHDRVSALVDPLWDPIRGELPSRADLRELRPALERLSRLVSAALREFS